MNKLILTKQKIFIYDSILKKKLGFIIVFFFGKQHIETAHFIKN